MLQKQEISIESITKAI